MNTISNKFTRFKQSCHCAICQATARANGRAGATRRAATYSTASLRQLLNSPYATATAFYTSMVACVMTMDGGFKTNRLVRWESAIAYERSTIRQLSAEESRIKKKLEERLPVEDDVQDTNRIEGMEGPNEQQLLEEADRDMFENGSSVKNLQLDVFARRASESSQDHKVTSEEDTELHLEEISDWQKAYKGNPCEHGQALELSAPVLGPEQQVENIDPQSIYASPRLRQLLYSHRWTPKKLRTAEVVTARLVVQLLLHHKLYNMPDLASGTSQGINTRPDVVEEDTNESRIPAKVRQLAYSSREELQDLNNLLHGEKDALAHVDPFDDHYDDSLPEFVPAYSQDPSGIYHKVIRKVNGNIRSNFQKYHAGELDLQTTIANVCNELLTSSAAPNLHTYNVLLMELSSLARNSLYSFSFANSGGDTTFPSPNSSQKGQTAFLAKAVGPVVDSIYTALRDARIRPNETTCAAMLNHYTERDDAEAFAHLVTLMRGQEEGLMLARPNITYDPEGSTKTRLKAKVGRTEKIIQAVTPTPTVAEALIGGVLHFVGLKHALEMLESLAHDGWAFDERGLAAIVRHCAQERDWKNGAECWDRIRGLVGVDAQLRSDTNTKSEGDIAENPSLLEISSKPSISRYHRLSRTAYRAYIALCWTCGMREDMRVAVKEATERFRYSTKSILADLEPRARSRAHLWLRTKASEEEKIELDRRKASDGAINPLEVAATEREIINEDNKQSSYNGSESESEQEQVQETSIGNPIISTPEPSPSTIATLIPTTMNPGPATATLLSSSHTPENVFHTSPSSSSTDTIPDNPSASEAEEEEYQHHLHHTPSIPTPTDATDDENYMPTTPPPTITITPSLVPPADAQRFKIPSLLPPQLSSSSALPIRSRSPALASALALSSSSSSSSARTTTAKPTPRPLSVQKPRSSPSTLLLLPRSPFYNDVVVDVADLDPNASDVGHSDIPLVGIIST